MDKETLSRKLREILLLGKFWNQKHKIYFVIEIVFENLFLKSNFGDYMIFYWQAQQLHIKRYMNMRNRKIVLK